MIIHSRTISSLLAFIDTSPSPYHVVRSASAFLKDAGFSELRRDKPWQLERNHAYFLRLFDSSLVAFTIGKTPRANLRLAAAHTDFPCLRVKPAAAMNEHGYGKLNVELYGGMMYESWLDRPLSLAGKAALRGSDPFHPKTVLVDAEKPLLTIPRLAIHMNKSVNDGVALNPQKDMLPLMTLTAKDERRDFFLPFLAEQCRCGSEDILSYELTAYVKEEGCLLGLDGEFLSSPRLDNLTSVYACLTGLAAGKDSDGIHVAALFDNEEVGSRTKQGAASLALPSLLRRVYENLGYTAEEYDMDLAKAFILSVDVAHAVHPNAAEKCDPTNIPVLGRGIAIKTACTQSYAGDAEAVATVIALCRQGHIPYQRFVNRSDMPGGSTLGSILSANMPARTMDIGIPILAMHSARELMGAADQQALNDILTLYYTL